jgi:hypothetical protein
MSTSNDQDKRHANTTDPQENEKDGNVFGDAFDKISGNSEGGKSMSEDESKKPGNQESIKDTDN